MRASLTLLIHLKLIKANLRIKVVQANKEEKVILMMLSGGYLYNHTLFQEIALKLCMTLPSISSCEHQTNLINL